MLDEMGEFEKLKSLENEEIEVSKFESFEFESGREFGVWKFVWGSSLEVWSRGNALREGARRRTAGERVGVYKAALRLEFES